MPDNKLKKIKVNEKSEIYENDIYKVKVYSIDGWFYKKNNSDFVEYGSEMEEDDYKYVKAIKLEITNKNTNKTSQKRCYQGYGVINDVQQDLDGGKIQFKNMFKKIDEK